MDGNIKKYSYEANGVIFDLEPRLFAENLPPTKPPYVLVRFWANDKLIGSINVVIRWDKYLKTIERPNNEEYIYDRCLEQCKEKQCGERLLALNNPNIILTDEEFHF
jgi:hypothetical protein